MSYKYYYLKLLQYHYQNPYTKTTAGSPSICSSARTVILVAVGIEELSQIDCSPENGAKWMLRQPLVGAFQMVSMVTNRNHPRWILRLDLIQADRTFFPHHELLSGDLGKLVQLRRRQANPCRRLQCIAVNSSPTKQTKRRGRVSTL
ncbi:hypothetical protein LINPERHAP1_LOCUS35237 [Linum perenne]